jgi:hypothetical protein
VINHLPGEKNGERIGRMFFTAAKDAKEIKNEYGMFL